MDTPILWIDVNLWTPTPGVLAELDKLTWNDIQPKGKLRMQTYLENEDMFRFSIFSVALLGWLSNCIWQREDDFHDVEAKLRFNIADCSYPMMCFSIHIVVADHLILEYFKSKHPVYQCNRWLVIAMPWHDIAWSQPCSHIILYDSIKYHQIPSLNIMIIKHH